MSGLLQRIVQALAELRETPVEHLLDLVAANVFALSKGEPWLEEVCHKTGADDT
jgi:hypothetical protein